jgi:hypothetical protein
MRGALGDGYVRAARTAWPEVPETVDFVMFWYHHAAQLTREGAVRRFGFITTNSVTQTFNRPVVEDALASGLRICFAIPDHPWVDSADGAQVRVAMSALDKQAGPGTLLTVCSEGSDRSGVHHTAFQTNTGVVFADFSTGMNTAVLNSLKANAGLACPGVQLSGQGFIVTPTDLARFSAVTRERVLRRYVTGRDITQVMREQYVLDTFGLTMVALRDRYPDAFQWLQDHVAPERAQNPREKYRRDWWIHAEPRGKYRSALAGLSRFIVTSRTARHRTFQILDASYLPETKVLIFAFDDAFFLGVLSSRVHVTFANRVGGWLGVGNDSTYNHSDCLEKFPFPEATGAPHNRVRDLAETLDAHRKRQQSLFPDLTITGMYNVVEKLRSGDQLTAKEKVIHEQGLVSVLKQLHDELDAAVFDAYGWPHDLTDEQILERLVALNADRAEEERHGLIRWLRPEFQNPGGAAPQVQTEFTTGDQEGGVAPPAAPARRAWPKPLPERIAAVRDLLAASGQPWDLPTVTAAFTGARRKDVEAVLDSLASIGLILAYDSDSGRRWRAST